MQYFFALWKWVIYKSSLVELSTLFFSTSFHKTRGLLGPEGLYENGLGLSLKTLEGASSAEKYQSVYGHGKGDQIKEFWP
jgi:hypothetical protein